MLSGKPQPFCLGLNVLTWYVDGTPTSEVTPVTIPGCPAMSSHKIPWHFPDHFVVFPDHETYHRHFITALTLILQEIWQITHQK